MLGPVSREQMLPPEVISSNAPETPAPARSAASAQNVVLIVPILKGEAQRIAEAAGTHQGSSQMPADRASGQSILTSSVSQ